MKTTPLPMEGLKLVELLIHGDQRGFLLSALIWPHLNPRD